MYESHEQINAGKLKWRKDTFVYFKIIIFGERHSKVDANGKLVLMHILKKIKPKNLTMIIVLSTN